MNAKVLDFIYTVLEHVARESYLKGHRDGGEKKAPLEQGFAPSRGTKLTIKTALEKHLKIR